MSDISFYRDWINSKKDLDTYFNEVAIYKAKVKEALNICFGDEERGTFLSKKVIEDELGLTDKGE